MIDHGRRTRIYDLAIHPGGKRVLIADGDSNVDELIISTGQHAHSYGSSSRSWKVTDVALSPDGRTIAAGADDGDIELWDFNTEAQKGWLIGPGDIEEIEFNPQGNSILAASAWTDQRGRKLVVWNTDTKRYYSLPQQITVRDLAFSPNGQILAGVSSRYIYLWENTTITTQYEDPAEASLNDSYAKFNGATLIDGLTINRADMYQATQKNSFNYRGLNKFILLEQHGETCGTTSAEMVLHYYGKDVGQREIWREGDIDTVDAGSWPGELETAMRKLGVHVNWDHNKLNLSDLKRCVRENRPPIILLRFDNLLHYVVVVGYNNRGDFLIADPNERFRWLSTDEMRKGWSLDPPGLPNSVFGVKNGFDAFALNVLTKLIDTTLDGNVAIVPSRPPTQHFAANWSEMKAESFHGDRAWNPFFRTRLKRHTFTFANDFTDYRVSAVKPFYWRIPASWTREHASLVSHQRDGRKVTVTMRLMYGKATRGYLEVLVRTYKHPKGTPVAAAPSAVPINDPSIETSLLTNYPKPFNPETWIPYQLEKPAEVRITIHSIDGELIKTLELGQKPAGMYLNQARAAYWDGRNTLRRTCCQWCVFLYHQSG